MAKTKKASAKVTVDRRGTGRRTAADRRQKAEQAPVERRQLERREKVNRRRQIDPTTCERDYNDDELEFMQALDEYKRKNGRMFPTCSEILEVIRDLGYAKMPQPPAAPPAADQPEAANGFEIANGSEVTAETIAETIAETTVEPNNSPADA